MLRYPKNLRISDTIVYLSAHKSAYVSVFYCLLLDTCPLNHIVIVLFNDKQISFVKYRRLCALQAIAKDTDVKRTGEEVDYVASFVTEIVFQGQVGQPYGRVVSWLFHLTYDR